MDYRTEVKHERRHERLLIKGEGFCKLCGKSATDILFDESYSSIIIGGHYGPEDEFPSFHNAIKILEEQAGIGIAGPNQTTGGT